MLKTLRWLLVFLLPFMGLYAGSTLMPQVKPLWERELPEKIIPLGLVDNDQTFLMAERISPNTEKEHLESLVGIDAETGTERFREKLPPELRQLANVGSRSRRLSANGSIILFHDNKDKSIFAYDWKRKAVVKRYMFAPSKLNVNEAVLHSKTLVCFAWNVDEQTGIPRSFLIGWSVDQETPRWTLEIGEEAIQLFLSDDGEIAAINTVTKKKDEIVVVNTKTGQFIQRIAGHVQDLDWSNNNQQMQLILNDAVQCVVQHYQLQDGQFALTSIQAFAPRCFYVSHDNELIAGLHAVGSTPLRRKLRSILKERLYDMLATVWPVSIVVTLHDRNTSEPLRKLDLPEDASPGQLFPLRNRNSLIISGGSEVACWPYVEQTTWPKWLGLVFGLLLAVLVARENLRLSHKPLLSQSSSPPI